MKIGEFFVELLVDAGKGELTIGNLVKGMGALEVASVGEVAVLYQLATQLAKITDSAINSALGLHHYAAATGASTKALQEWQSAARHTTVSADQVEQAMLGISEQLEDIRDFGQVTGPLKNLLEPLKGKMSFEGLTAEHPEEVLKRIRTAMQGIPAARQEAILRHAGLGSMLELIQMSQKDFAKFSKEAGFQSEREIEKYRKIHSQFATIENTTIRIKNFIADWFSDTTLVALSKIGEILKTEYESLVQIRAYMDSRKPGETAVDRLKELKPEAKVEGLEVMRLLLDPEYRERLLTGLRENKDKMLQNAGQLPASPVNKKTEVHVTNKIIVQGTKHNASELMIAVQEGVSRAIQHAVVQSDIGVTA